MSLLRLPLFALAWPRWLADVGLRRAFQAWSLQPHRNHRAMRYWLKAGANPNQKRFGDEDTWRLLHVAAEGGDTEAVELLLAYGATVDPVATPHRETPIAMALREKHRAISELLARAGADLEHACRFSYKSSEHASLERDWFNLYPTNYRTARQSFRWQSGYRAALPSASGVKKPSKHTPRPQTSIEDLRVGCVDNAKATAFSQGGVCEPNVRALMHNLGWEDLVDISKTCAQGRQLEAAWAPLEQDLAPPPAPSRPRL